MEVGDHLITSRMGYAHHGLYIGSNKVIHYSGFANGPSDGVIEIVSLDSFGSGCAVAVKNHLFRVHDGQDAVDRGVGRLGEARYNLLTNNCEHFVHYCINGMSVSGQVNGFALGAIRGPSALAEAAVMQAVKSSAPILKDAATVAISSASAISVETGIKVAAVGLCTVVAGPVLLPFALAASVWSAISK